MTTITTNRAFAGLDVDEVCRNWRTYSDGNEYAMGNRWAAAQMLVNALNHAAARQIKRVQFQIYLHPDFMQPAASDPLFNWTFDDLVHDGRDVVYRIVLAPRESGSGDCYAARTDSHTVDRTPNIALTRSLTYPEGLLETEFTFTRGNRAAVEDIEELSTYNDFAIVDLQVVDKPILVLDTGTHENFVDARGRPSDNILANYLEAVRAAFHTLRTTNLPILSNWSATQQSGSYLVAASPPALGFATGDQFGVRVYSNAYNNILNLDTTARDATSPGIMCHVANTGIGRNTVAKGWKLRAQCRVLAKKVAREGAGGSLVGTVKFEGPLDSVEILVTGGTNWYGDTADLINLDTSQDDDEASSALNKIDIMAKGQREIVVETWEGVECQVFGWAIWVGYNSYW